MSLVLPSSGSEMPKQSCRRMSPNVSAGCNVHGVSLASYPACPLRTLRMRERPAVKSLRPANCASFPLRNYALGLIAAIILAGCSRSVAETSVDESTSAGSKSASSTQQVSEHTTAAKPPAASESDSVFGLTKIWNIHVRVSKRKLGCHATQIWRLPWFRPSRCSAANGTASRWFRATSESSSGEFWL